MRERGHVMRSIGILIGVMGQVLHAQGNRLMVRNQEGHAYYLTILTQDNGIYESLVKPYTLTTFTLPDGTAKIQAFTDGLWGRVLQWEAEPQLFLDKVVIIKPNDNVEVKDQFELPSVLFDRISIN